MVPRRSYRKRLTTVSCPYVSLCCVRGILEAQGAMVFVAETVTTESNYITVTYTTSMYMDSTIYINSTCYVSRLFPTCVTPHGTGIGYPHYEKWH